MPGTKLQSSSHMGSASDAPEVKSILAIVCNHLEVKPQRPSEAQLLLLNVPLPLADRCHRPQRFEITCFA
jgi:hypothetical protein